ncbi:Peptidase S8 and S53, subtilisin, kexin, sedolisin precursor [Sphingopyxis sp. LC81]|uniref:S8 family peptidase n=1 Tax=Sphingopyxis sp. LC81 TaxID=1502850 RepID=UPI00050F83FC|nr:S8 family serine peptidase [Sphingopyxis sp. LC81]KGB54763.1 Peptidase S8 and S53, subtilisin, kexin, sedolisin precursor [Sphingopyxis sp. LC81]
MPSEAVLGQELLDERRTETRRYKLRFPTREALEASLAIEAVGGAVAVALPERRVISLDVPAAQVSFMAEGFEAARQHYGAEIVEDYRYSLEQLDFYNPLAFAPEGEAQQSLDDVIEAIGAPQAWSHSRGEGVVIAIVDTGIDGLRPEFPHYKRHPRSWAANGEDPWTDWQGHGSMCAAIAAGTRSQGGEFDGVAPDAMIMSCRTHFYDTELAAIYDELTSLAREGATVIASNSFGVQSGSPPPVPADSDFIPALDDAIAAGVIVCFSAGNYHHLAGGTPDGHEPNSIWLHKGRSDLLTVGAAKPDGSMWYYSSRGPGQFPGQPLTSPKPDLVGITPPFGRVVYGSNVSVLKDGWGTSGCCPQAAGLIALLQSKRHAEDEPPLSRDQLFDVIRKSSVSLGHHGHSQGAGRLDCEAAVNRI